MTDMEAGILRARCTGEQDVSWGMSQNGNLQVGLVFEILQEPYVGRRIGWSGSFANEKSTDITLKALENCGWSGDDPTVSLAGIEQNEVEIVIDIEADDLGKTYPKVRWVNKPYSGKIKFKTPASQTDLASFRNDIRGAVLERRRANPPAQSGPSTVGRSPGGQRPAANLRARPSASSAPQQQRPQGPGNPAARRDASQQYEPDQGYENYSQSEDDDIPF